MAEAGKSNRRASTNEDTCGPYYPIAFCDGDRMDIVTLHPGLINASAGQPIILRGRLIDINGHLANGALLEFWQANAAGVYRTPAEIGNPGLDPAFEGNARCRTADGSFELRTIKPGASSSMGETRAPNITLTVFSDGTTRIVTQIFFEGEPGNDGDALLQSLPNELRHRLIARRSSEIQADGDLYTIDIVLAGENETPFFDDLTS